MQLPNEYKTGNAGTDRLIAKALAKERKTVQSASSEFIKDSLAKKELNKRYEFHRLGCSYDALMNRTFCNCGGVKVQKNKYNVAPKEERTKDGITFASKAEMEEDDSILLEVKSGKYWNLLRQPKFLLTRKRILADGTVIRASFYVADWMYMDEDHIYVVEKKGFKTKEYILKKKMFLEKYSHFVFIER